MLIASYVFGFLGIASSIVIYQQRKRIGLLISKLLSDVIWFFHYLFIYAYSGAAIAVIGFVREIIFINRNKKWAKSPLWLVLFLLLSAGAGFITWKNVFSIFPCVASALAVISFWIGNPRLARILSFPISAFMLTYAISFNGYLVIANEILSLTSSTIGIIRHDIKKRVTAESDLGKEALDVKSDTES